MTPPPTETPPGAGTHTSTRIRRPRWRARLVRGFFVFVVAGQALLLVRAYGDPHRYFGFQPFRESSAWQADIVRVTDDGRRVPIDDDWPGGYEWDELVAGSIVTHPGRTRHASYGIDTTVDFLGDALDWVADNTPEDHETRYLEATVTSTRNTRERPTVILRSHERSLAQDP